MQRFPELAVALLAREAPSDIGWPQAFRPIDADLEWPGLAELQADRITLLGHTRAWGGPHRWSPGDTFQLWRYHLHYWDWAWGLVNDADRRQAKAKFAELFGSWQQQTSFGRWEEWSPYVVALRSWSWCGQYDALVRGTAYEREFIDLLMLHARFLQANLELDVRGNHLVKDLKGLIGLAVFLRQERLLRWSLSRLRRETATQVLADGGHYERAPAYHCQVLGDMLDIAGLLDDQCPMWLAEAVERMRRWLGLVMLPDGSVPLLNDGYPVSPALAAALVPGPAAADGVTLLEQSGIAVLRSGDLYVVADVGLPCPDELPAHAHADTLGFLMYSGMSPVVGEAGTSTYEEGPVREYERSTAAHSTVQIDGVDSTEVWGAFRAARRARPRVIEAAASDGIAVLSASHDGYTRLQGRPVHTRTWTLTASRLKLVDVVTGSGEHNIALRLHGTPRKAVARDSPAFVERVTQSARGWNVRDVSTVLEHSVRARLPWRHETDLTAEEGG